MKVGVALCGCDTGGIAVYSVLMELERQGLEIGMISASGIPAAGALLYAYGCEEGLAEDFIREVEEEDLDTAIHSLAGRIPTAGRRGNMPIVINAVDVGNGAVTQFTNDFVLEGAQLRTHPIEDAYDALSASISPADGLACYRFGGEKLCDYAVWHGNPVHPLRMRGIEKVLTVVCMPEEPRTPHQALVKRLAAGEPRGNVHLEVLLPHPLPDWKRLSKIATLNVKSCIDGAALNLL